MKASLHFPCRPGGVIRRGAVLVPLLAALTLPALVCGTDAQSVRRLFAHPPRQYSTAPLWVWNDQLTEAQIRGTLRDLAGQQVKQVFVHPRPGLMTPYLGPEWFRLWRVALEEAARLDMNVWIYDENSYPSGFAGGWVPELMPDSRGMGLHIRETQTVPKWTDDTVAIYRLEGDQFELISAKAKAGESLPEGRYLVATLQRAGDSPWHGNRCYVNLLTPGVTEKFLEVTLEAYKRAVGTQFGKRIPGVFTDEPNIRPAGGFPWCPDLPEQFQQRWGYPLLDHLPSLVRELGDWRKVRHNYFSTLNDLFIERWARPYYEWCEKNDLAFTGHYWDHEWPHCLGVPDNMAMAAWQHIPGIDVLMNQYAEHTHAQFGNVRFCREISSIANQLGRSRTLVELYGAGGWDLRFEDMKRIGDWLQVLGINLMNEHLSYVTIRGARKRDHPPSFSYHEPWWEAYHMNAGYFARLSAAMSQGEQINRILVIEPTTTAWMYQGHVAKLRELGDAFFQLLLALEAAQIEYDLGCEDVLARHGAVVGNQLRVGRRFYDVVVLPPHTENISLALLRLGETYLEMGGTVLCLGDPPTRVDGAPSSRPAEGAGEPGWVSATPAQAVEALERLAPTPGFRIRREPGDRGLLFHHRRHLADGQILLLVNTSIQAPSAGRFESELNGVERWDPYTGKVAPYPFTRTTTGVQAAFHLPPAGSLLLFLSAKPLKPAPAPAETSTRLTAAGPLEIHRLEPNVLTLDYVDITAGGETRSNLYFYAANQFVWQKHGLPHNPWDNAVQFKDELITKRFPADSGFTASYRFTLEGPVPTNLAIVIERPDLYTITCNGRPVSATPDDWWLDKAFGRVPIAATARVGENVVTLWAQPFTLLHELEPAYVLGNFTLKPASWGFVLAPDAPLQIPTTPAEPVHSVNPDGTMWLSGGVGFEPGREDRAPFVVFDLGRLVDLAAVQVWNYCESHERELSSRGTHTLLVWTGPAPDQLTPRGSFVLARARGPAQAQSLPVKAAGVRYVKLEPRSNHAGVIFHDVGAWRIVPAEPSHQSGPADHDFVGLAEVRFIDAAGAAIGRVQIHQASSELASHRRRAVHLVDGSGLEVPRPGWNQQGHPFYAHGVAYRQQFHVPNQRGRFVVALPDWYGSVARVDVNGRTAGYIVAAPWELEVTKQLKRGRRNTLTVVVFGTLKNTLGPHHGNPALGSAWPGMFQNGPVDGPPPGTQYATVGYGLFAPFTLWHVQPASGTARSTAR